MFNGLKKIAGNIKGANYIFKNMRHIAKLCKDYGLVKKNFPDADLKWATTKQFHQVFSQGNIAERYRRLTKNLDARSMADVSDIINGVLTLDSGEAGLRGVLKEGPAEIAKLNAQFFDRILKLSDDLFVWGNFILPVCHFDPACLYFRNGLDFLRYPGKLRQADIIDAGGFVGDSILVLSPQTQRTVHCFEPVSSHIDIIKRTLELNSISNAVVQRAALGDLRGEIKISMEDKVSGGAFTSQSTMTDLEGNKGKQLPYEETVPQITLDSYVEGKGLTKVGLIKMDIEGAEKSALIGAEKTIRKYKPSLLISIYHHPDDFFDIKPMIESWDLGYEFQIRRCPGYLFSDTTLVAEFKGDQ